MSSDVPVGRDDELAVLRDAFDSAAAGRPTIVLFVGEAGIGKTRLADEAAVTARAAGMRVVRGEADAAVREPMELWRGVYRSLSVGPVSDPALPAEERRWEHLESLAEALISSAPAMVVLEDLHWADAMAVWVLEHLPRALGEAAIVIVATSREHEPGMPRLDALRRVSRLVPLGGLDVESVRRLAVAHGAVSADAAELRARTGGNPLFVRELLRAPDGGGVISEVLDRALARLDADTRALLAAVALAGPGTPLAVVATATSMTAVAAADRLAAALRDGVVDEVTLTGVRFHHVLLADAAGRLADAPATHARLAAAWEATGGLEGRSAAAGHRVRAAVGPSEVADAVAAVCDIAAELVAAGQQTRAAGLLRDACDAAAACVDRPDLRARLSLDLAEVLGRLGDFDQALVRYHEAAELARGSQDHLLRARAEACIGLSVINPIIPDPWRVHRLEEALAALPPEELHLRAALLGRLAAVGRADADAVGRVRVWADEALDAARRTGDPVLIVQAVLDRYMAPLDRATRALRITMADEVVGLAERAGRGDLALQGHQWRYCHHLNRGEVVAASYSLERAELLAALLPSPAWRQRTLVRRTTLLALAGGRSAVTASMAESVRVGTGHIEPFMLLRSELMHRLMLLELYGGSDPRAEELYCAVDERVADVPSPYLQLQQGHAAQILGHESRVHEVLQRYAREPERVMRSLTGDHLLRILGDTVARAGATALAAPVYRALLPDAGLLNVGAGVSVGLPVDDVLARLAALAGDHSAAVRHARDAVALARSIPSPPMLVHCLDHLAAAAIQVGDDDAAVRAEAGTLAAALGIERTGREPPPVAPRDERRAAAMRRDGPLWVLTSPLGGARLSDSTGLGQLARLLTTPGAEVAAIELARRVETPAADLGPVLDTQAKRAYRRRLLELQAEVDDAAAANDTVRGERAHVEIDALLRELKRAVGLGGRDRPTGSDAERARVNVVRSLRRAIAAIAQEAPQLGAHLEESVRTGRYCMYLPEPAAALFWSVEA